MQPGDLVYHLEDIRTSDLGPVPGLIIKKRGSDLVVYFTDRTFSEYHDEEDLVKVEDYTGVRDDYR
jgi:hypothetical protein